MQIRYILVVNTLTICWDFALRLALGAAYRGVFSEKIVHMEEEEVNWVACLVIYTKLYAILP